MASYNRVTFVGNLTREPELKSVASGMVIANFGIAVNNRIKKKDEWVDDVMFIDVAFFGKTAEVCGQYLNKGSQVLVEGKLRLEQWEKDGQKRSRHTVTGDRLVMLGAKGSTSGGDNREPSGNTGQAAPQSQDDLTPF